MKTELTIYRRIENSLIRYLKASRGIDAITAEFSNTDPGDPDSGCDTCGWGSEDMSFDIRYQKEVDGWFSSVTINGDPLQFLPTIFEYDVED